MYDCINRPDTRLHPTKTQKHQINPCNAGAIHTGRSAPSERTTGIRHELPFRRVVDDMGRSHWIVPCSEEGMPAQSLGSAGITLPISAHFFGTAKAMISSLVTSDPVRLPPVLTTVTNCLPSAPK